MLTTASFHAAPAACLAGLLLLALSGPAPAQRLPPDAAIIAGFERVVFGAEITGPFSDGSYLKRFSGPVRVRVRNGAALDRREDVGRFIREVDRDMEELDIRLAGGGEAAGFTVHVVDRADYGRVGRAVYGNPFLQVPGNCIVRVSYSRRGIRSADAIIVSDEGDARFRRCLVEEVLQGLGPLADNPDAPQSVFNDTTRLTAVTRYDLVLLNMLYDPRLRPGMSRAEAAPLLPAVLEAAKRAAPRG